MRPRSSAQPPERRPQWTRSRDLDHPPTMIHGGHQGFQPDIDPDHRPRPRMPIREVTVDFHGEGHEPALGAPGDGGGEDPGPSLRQLASQGLGGLVGAEGAQPGEGDRGPRAAHHPGAEAEGIPAPALLLALGEAQTGAFPLAPLGGDEVTEGSVQVAEGLLYTSSSPSTRPAWGPAASLDSRSDEGRRPSTTASRPRTASGTDPIPSSRRISPLPRGSGASAPGREWGRARTGRPGAPHEAGLGTPSERVPMGNPFVGTRPG